MPARRRARAASSAASVAALLLAGCVTGGGHGGSGGDAPEKRPTTSVPEADPAGAEDVAAVMADYLEAFRTAITTVDLTTPSEGVQSNVRPLRDALFDADSDLRDLEVANPALVDVVSEFYDVAAGAISAYDDYTTVEPTSLGEAQSDAVRQANVDAMTQAVTLQHAASSLVLDGAVSDAPSPAEVLAAPEDLPDIAGGSVSVTLEGEVPSIASGPCGTPSPTKAIEPTLYASSVLEGASGYAVQRVFQFEGEQQAANFVEASRAYLDCDSPDGMDITIDEVDGGHRFVGVDENGLTFTAYVVADGRRALMVDAEGTDLAAGEDVEETTRGWAEDVLEFLRERSDS